MPSKITNRLSRTRGADHQPPDLVPVAKRRMGRPEIEVHPEMVRIACVMARYGATDVEIAQELGISERAFYDVCSREPEFLQAIKEGKDAIDDRVERSLLQTATGFTYETEKVFSNGFRAKVHERVLPNPGAQMHWLRNRRNWRAGDNVVQDAIDAATPTDASAPADTRTLAMAALALLGAALAPQASPEPRQTIDGVVNQPTIDDEDDMDEEPVYDDRDPDFDI